METNKQHAVHRVVEKRKMMDTSRLLRGAKKYSGVGIVLAVARSVVISTLRLFPAREERRQLLGILRSVQGPIQVRKSCLACRIYQEDGFEEAVFFYEQWDSEAEFERHVRSELYRRILQALELSRKTPEMQIHYLSNTRGLDLIEYLRTNPEVQKN